MAEFNDENGVLVSLLVFQILRSRSGLEISRNHTEMLYLN